MNIVRCYVDFTYEFEPRMQIYYLTSLISKVKTVLSILYISRMNFT